MRAAVDIGSNSVKFVLCDERRVAPGVVKTASWVTRLGRFLEKTGRLDPEAVNETKNAFLEMKKQITELAPLCDYRVVATSAVRDSKNPEEIGRLVKEIFGTELRVLSGSEEAYLSIRGASESAQLTYGSSFQTLFIDVGGASTEVGQLEPKFVAHSFQAGAVRCHEALGLDQMPVENATWESAKKGMQNFFPAPTWNALKEKMDTGPHPRAVAVGGSLILAAKLSQARKAPEDSGFLVETTELEKTNERLRKLSLEERLQLPNMQKGRADVVVAGLLCLTTLLRRLACDSVLITNWGLRYGILRCWEEFSSGAKLGPIDR